MSKRERIIDGNRFPTLEGFYAEAGRVGLRAGKLDAFNDVLLRRFHPPNGFVLVWKHASLSRARLDHAETARVLQRRLKRCDPTARESVAEKKASAERGEGPTVFDWLVEIIQEHGDNGSEPDGVELVLDWSEPR